jgi:ATP-binding protein involved in chromosome partitioning
VLAATPQRKDTSISTADDIREALAQVQDPAHGRSLVSSEMLGEVIFADGKATVAIRLTTPLCPSREEIRTSAQAAAMRVAGVTSVEIAFAAEVARKAGPARERLPKVRNIIAVAAGKGGVGKSTVATNLAVALAQAGTRVGILDADVFGPSIPQMMGQPQTAADIQGEHIIIPAVHHGIKVLSVGFFVDRGAAVIWRGPMIHKLLTQFVEDVDWGELDYLVIDLPPGTGDTQLSLAQLVPVTGAVMVTTPQEVSVIDVEKALAMWKKVEVPVLGIIENMSFFACPKCGHHEEIFAHGGGRRLAEREGLPFLGEIPLLSSVRGGGDNGRPIVLAEPESAVSQAFFAIAGRVACALSVRNLPDPGTAKRSSKLSVLK